ncbi:MAG: class I SAM-dependent methyltransferase, partial [Nocardiopsaceae bacterium]|nr:class I SAM-dependent methyltransferase [Nocardiopsaceae bacterium]
MSRSDAGTATGSPDLGDDPDLAGLLSRWRTDLAAWAIPDHILASVPESPWVLPRQMFARRADKLAAEPAGPSYERAWAALDPHGSVLDVGSGPGAACLPLLPRTTDLTAVDVEEEMLALLADRAKARRVTARCVAGRWPDVAPKTPVADVVTCHHVVYNVPDLGPFLVALGNHARRQVIVETADLHPMTSLNELWLRFHDLRRPDQPTADDVLAILRGM